MTSLTQLPSEIVTEITMSRDRIPWVIVEGDTDERLLRSRYFNCSVKIVVAEGWENVRDVLDEVDRYQTCSRIVGVIDRDYRDQNSTQLSKPRIVLTDFRDIENTMFRSSALRRVYSELGAIAKMPKSGHDEIDFNLISKRVIEVTEKIGLFRSFCFVEDLRVSFKGIDYTKFVCDRTLDFNQNNFISHLNGKNPGHTRISQESWSKSQQRSHVHVEFSDSRFICNGHDLMGVVALSLKRMWGSKGGSISRAEVESAFRIGFCDSELYETRLWKDLIKAITP